MASQTPTLQGSDIIQKPAYVKTVAMSATPKFSQIWKVNRRLLEVVFWGKEALRTC